MAKYEATASWAVWPSADAYTSKTDISFPMRGVDGVYTAEPSFWDEPR
jgi:hypothetical protein